MFNNKTNVNYIPVLESSNYGLYLQEEEYDNNKLIDDYEKGNLYLTEEEYDNTVLCNEASDLADFHYEDEQDDYDYDLIEGHNSETYKLLFEWFEPWLPGDED